MGVEQATPSSFLSRNLEWRTAQTEAGLIEAYKEALDQSVPGITQSWAQPIEMRMDDLLQGVMADLAIVIHGTDTATLHDLADQVARVVSGVPGAGRRAGEANGRPAGSPRHRQSRCDRTAAGSTRPRCSTSSKRLAGRTVGTMKDGDERYNIRVRLAPQDR